MNYKIPVQKVKWLNTKVTKVNDNPPPKQQWLYNINLPDWLAVWDVFAGWERARFMHMQKRLTTDDVLFDIGAENGWQSAIYSKYFVGKNIVLFEPNFEYWPNIKETFKHNDLETPIGTFNGFAGNNIVNPIYWKNSFPKSDAEFNYRNIINVTGYRYIHQHEQTTSQTTIDEFIKQTGIIPTAITADTEGAELLIVRGSEQALTKNRIKVWLSIHPELALKDYGHQTNEIFDFMQTLGYTGELLGTDHEEHWYFSKQTVV